MEKKLLETAEFEEVVQLQKNRKYALCTGANKAKLSMKLLTLKICFSHHIINSQAP